MIDLGISFIGGNDEWRALADMTGTTTRVLEEEGFGNAVRRMVMRRTGEHLESRMVTELGDLTICPFGYRLARAAGYDPAAIILLARVMTAVQVNHDRLGTPIVHHVQDGRIFGASPVADGVFWLTTDGDPHSARLVIDPIPDTMATHIMGRPLREVVFHPDLDAMDMRIADVEQYRTKTHLVLEGAPPPVSVIEAMESWEEGDDR